MPSLCGIEAAIRLKEGVGCKGRLLELWRRIRITEGAALRGLGIRVEIGMATDLCIAIKEAMAGRLFVSPSVPYVTQNDQLRRASLQ